MQKATKIWLISAATPEDYIQYIGINLGTPKITVFLPDTQYAALSVRNSTGDVHGSLLSEKIFIAQTDTGDVTVPRISSGGMCQIDTTTGDIHITLVS